MKLVAIGSEKTEAATGAHKSGCCAEKPVAAEPSRRDGVSTPPPSCSSCANAAR